MATPIAHTAKADIGSALNKTDDSARRLTNVTSPAGSFKYYFAPSLNSRTISSRLVQELVLPNTSYITNLYDAQARLTDTSLRQSSGTITNRHAYTYNYANQRVRQTLADGSYRSYWYDNAGELYSSRTTNSVGLEITNERFGYLYDPAWNLTMRTNNTSTLALPVDIQNQLTAVGGNSVSYDPNGNLTSQLSGMESYSYNDENELTQATYAGYWQIAFVYDGLHRLRKTTDSIWDGSGYSFSSETRYIYDGELRVQERDQNNVPTVTYTRGPDLSGTIQGAGGIGGLLARSSGYSGGSWSTHHFYHADGSGNITAMIDATQTLSATYKYKPYGALSVPAGRWLVPMSAAFRPKRSIPIPPNTTSAAAGTIQHFSAGRTGIQYKINMAA